MLQEQNKQQAGRQNLAAKRTSLLASCTVRGGWG
jgi:hypothetical protein